MTTSTQQRKKLSQKSDLQINHSMNLSSMPTKSFFLKPTSSDEIINLISTLIESKSVDPNSLPTKIPKLLKNDISQQ